MLDRREFLRTMTTSAAALALPSLVDANEQCIDINQRLCGITTELRNSPVIQSVDMHMVCHPTTSLVQWRWAHFLPEIELRYSGQVEQVNSNLLTAMKQVRAISHSGLDVLIQEGMVKGKEEHFVQLHEDIAKDLLYMGMTTAPIFHTEMTKTPTKEDVEKAMHDTDAIRQRVTHYVRTYFGDERRIRFSPLGRVGAGYFLSSDSATKLVAMEDPTIDAKARDAQYGTDKESFEKWVIAERDAHLINLVRESRRPVQHVLLGFSHDLTDDIAASNAANREQISHIIVNAKGLPKDK